MTRFIAFYLPQFYPTLENDEWWGKGFTEWVNVAKARPLYRGHDEPHIPADLGFYDLRLPAVRELQAELARKAGIEGFCYYHYWFGNGKQILERPFNEVVESGKPDFPFCLCWANHSWYKKLWDPNNKGKGKLLAEQLYPGESDYIAHFNALLPAFKDKRYIKVNGKLFFIIYDAIKFEDIEKFSRIWRELAKKNGLSDFYFVATDQDSRKKDVILSKGIDAIYNSDQFNIHHHLSKWKKLLLYASRRWLKRPTVFDYRDAANYMMNDDCKSRSCVIRPIPVHFPGAIQSPNEA